MTLKVLKRIDMTYPEDPLSLFSNSSSLSQKLKRKQSKYAADYMFISSAAHSKVYSAREAEL